MPGKDEAKKAAPKAAERSAERAEGTDASATLNKAQAEYQRYLKRMAGQPSGSTIPGYVAVPVGSDGMPGWGVPPSMAAMMPGGAGAAHAGVPSASLTDSLGNTIRLGIDLVNATLAGGAYVLNGLMGGGSYGYEHSHHGGCGCGGCGCDCCADECCGTDCCGCECCQPGVGSCC